MYSRDQLLIGRRPLCTLHRDVKYKVTQLQPRPIPVLCTTSRDRPNVCKHYDQLILSSKSTLQVRPRSRHNLMRVPLVDDVPMCSTYHINRTAGSPDITDALSCYVVNARSLKKPNAVQLLETEMISCTCDVAAGCLK